MRPIRLSIAGLHSFREKQEIDFSALSETGMFGIFGPTGSGKSTILDAMTLALYGDVGRAANNTQAILNHAEKRLEVAYEFEIGGATTRKRYRVERSYKRADGYSVPHQSSRLLELEPLVTLPGAGDAVADFGIIVLADSKNAVNQMIRDILGLEQSDFTRAVVLPQGKFAEFLQMKGADRNRMTERLFGFERYGQSLTDKIKFRAEAAEHSRAQVEAAQHELGDASVKAVQSADLAVGEAKESLRQSTIAVKEAQVIFSETQANWLLQARQSEALAALDVHREAAPEMEALRSKLAAATRARRTWPAVQSVQAAKLDVEERAQTQIQAMAAEESFRQNITRTQAVLMFEQGRREAEEPALMERRGQLTEVRLVEEELQLRQLALIEARQLRDACVKAHEESVQAIGAVEQAQVSLSAEIQSTQLQLDSYSVSAVVRQQFVVLEQTADAWQRQHTIFNQAELDLQRRERDLQKAQVEVAEVVKVRDGLLVQRSQLQRVLTEMREQAPATGFDFAAVTSWLAGIDPVIGSLADAENDDTQQEAEIQSLADELEQYRVVAMGAHIVANEAKRALVVIRKKREEQMQDDERDMARRLALTLQAGGMCPVCGSRHYPQPAAQPMDTAMIADVEVSHTLEGSTWMDWEAQITGVESSWQFADDGARMADGRVMKAEGMLANTLQDAARRKTHRDDLRARLVTAWHKVQSGDMGDVLKSSIEDYHQILESDSSAWRSKWNCLSGMIANMRQASVAWQQKLDEYVAQIAELENPIQQNHQVLAGKEQRVISCVLEVQGQTTVANLVQQDVASAALKLVEVLHALGLQSDNVEQEDIQFARQCLMRRAEDDALGDAARQQLVKWQALHTEQQVKVTTLRDQAYHHELAMLEAQSGFRQLELDVKERQERIDRVTGGVRVALAIVAVENRLEELRVGVGQATAAAVEADRLMNEAIKQRATAETEHQAAMRHLKRLLERLEVVLHEEHFSTIADIEHALLDDDVWEKGSQTLSQYDEKQVRLQANCENLEIQLQGRVVNPAQWRAVQDALVTAETINRTTMETYGASNSRYEDIREKHQRWLVLEEQRQQLTDLSTRLKVLRDTFRGNSFVEFMAREQMSGVARQASDRLETLTSGRYALELTDDCGFLMRDNHNGGVLRPVSTLSGGETFLTSLALALSLSSHIQLRGRYPLEFFFLDEGFGTLDGDLLDVVISTLEKLHMDKMSIGIISHVPELRQRLQRRLIVEPAEPAGRGTRLKLERA